MRVGRGILAFVSGVKVVSRCDYKCMLSLRLCCAKATHLRSLQWRTISNACHTTRTTETENKDAVHSSNLCLQGQRQKRRHVKDQDFVDHIILRVGGGKRI